MHRYTKVAEKNKRKSINTTRLLKKKERKDNTHNNTG
jgi:hypothetical protein